MADDTPVTDQQSDDASAQSHEDQGAAADSGVDETTQTSQDSDTDADATDDTSSTDDLPTQLLSEAEQDAINAIEDPDKRLKAFNRAWTQKTQRLATMRKELAPLQELKAALDSTDGPAAAIRRLAEHYGLAVTDPKATPAVAAEDLTEQITGIVRGSLGPEYEDLADRLAPAILKAAERVVADKTKPIQAHQEELVRESALRESTAVLESFSKTHPDWKQYEPKMLELSRRLAPGVDAKGNPEMSEPEYLDLLYKVVTADAKVGDGVKKVVARINKTAAATVRETKGVAGDKVEAGPVKLPTFDEAGAMARQGIHLRE